MNYVALLRGINVGGNSKIAMSDLKQCFESLGLLHVRTYINSGNVLFTDSEHDLKTLTEKTEAAITKMSGLSIQVLIVTLGSLQKIVRLVPADWKNNQTVKCDVFFVWPTVKTSNLVETLQANPDIEDVLYNETAVVWRIDRSDYNKSKVPKVITSGSYKQLTIRNINTVRKLVELFEN